MKVSVLAACLMSWGCSSAAPAPSSSAIATNDGASRPTSARSVSLASALARDTYGEMFYYPQRDETIARIWNEPGNPAALEALIDDLRAPVKSRLVAAEVLLSRDLTFTSRHDLGALARIYGQALQRQVTHLNAWGLLWYSDSAGPLGDHLIGLGEAALPVLREMLDDRTVLRGYVGSEDATIGNGARFRVRDFAAYYLSQIVKRPLGLTEEPPMQADYALRDAAIDRLISELPTE